MNNSVNEDYNESEAVVMTEEIGEIEVISEEQVMSETTNEDESNSNNSGDILMPWVHLFKDFIDVLSENIQ